MKQMNKRRSRSRRFQKRPHVEICWGSRVTFEPRVNVRESLRTQGVSQIDLKSAREKKKKIKFLSHNSLEPAGIILKSLPAFNSLGTFSSFIARDHFITVKYICWSSFDFRAFCSRTFRQQNTLQSS